MKRTTWLIGAALLCTLALASACQPLPDIPPTPVVPQPVSPTEPAQPIPTPAGEQPPADEPAEGRSGPKRGDPQPRTDLPPKGQGELLAPINPERGSKPPAEELAPVEPGTRYLEGDVTAKPPPDEAPGTTGEGPKELAPETSRARHGRVQFSMTRDGAITPEVVMVVGDELAPLTSIDGELIYVFTVDGEPVHVGSFRDPTYMVGLPLTTDQGYSVVELEEGTFTIAIPEALLDPAYLAAATLEFYRLDPGIPYDTPLTLETVRELIGASELIAEVRGLLLAELLVQR